MRRRQRDSESEDNHERWLVSYADLLTLLFAFFVVMYSISSSREGDYRVLSDSIVVAFAGPQFSREPVQVGELARMEYPTGSLAAAKRPLIVPMKPDGNVEPDLAIGAAAGLVAEVEQRLTRQFSKEIEEEQISLSSDGDRLQLELPAAMLFPSGSSALLASAAPALTTLAQTLNLVPYAVRVEGHSDNVPIRTGLFASNWDLSAARAASVVRFLQEAGVDSARLSALALADTKPVAGNQDEAGRARNRRVALVVETRVVD